MDYKYDRILGQNIRRLREKQNMTQEQLAAKLQVDGCDITRSALAKLEAGQRHFYAKEINALHRILEVSYDELFQIIG